MSAQGPLRFPHAEAPPFGEPIAVAPGVLWMRLPLPFRLNHVNVYLIEDGDGLALVDAGIDNEETRAIWRRVFDGPLKGRRLTRVIATHFHPDHIGLAGCLCELQGVKLYASLSEYLETLCLLLDANGRTGEPYLSFYRANGLSSLEADTLLSRGLAYLGMVAPPPRTFRRIVDGEMLDIGGRAFRVITGAGHSPEQALLHCAADNFILCADQVLPRISPNVSVEASDPDGDPLGLYLKSLTALKATLPADVLALPGHHLPFFGWGARIDELVAHHEARCAAGLEACRRAPHSVFDLVPVFFERASEDPHQLSFAFGEALAHVNCLVRRGQLEGVVDNGRTLFRAL